MTDEFEKEMRGLTDQLTAMSQELKANSEEAKAFRSKCAELDTQLAELKEFRARTVAPAQVGPSPEDFRAFKDFCTRGAGVSFEASGPDGGYIVPAELSKEIMKKCRDTDVFRQHAKIIQCGSNAVEIPLEDELPEVRWVGELETRTASDKRLFGKSNIAIDEMVTIMKVSARLLQDGVLANVESYVIDRMSDAINKAEGKAFVTGTGFKQPEGLFTCSDIPVVETGSAGAFGADDLVDVWADCPNAIDDTADYYVSKPIMARMRKFKTSGSGAYIWQDPIMAGAPPTFNGFPVRQLTSAPSTVSGGSKIAFFGALDKTYCIAERSIMTMIRDEKILFDEGKVKFAISRRVGGGVAMPDNGRILKVKA